MTDMPTSHRQAVLPRGPGPSTKGVLTLPLRLKSQLRRVARRDYTRRIGSGLVQLLIVILILMVFQASADWSFNLPWMVRFFFLIADLAILVILARFSFKGPLLRLLSLADAALLAERRWPDLRQKLISVVQVAEGNSYSTIGSTQLVSLLSVQVQAQTAPLKFSQVVSLSGLYRLLLIVVCLGAGTAILGYWTWPASGILTERIFLSSFPLPTKTLVIPITRDLVRPIGSDFELSARAQGVIPETGRLAITYKEKPTQYVSLRPNSDNPKIFSFELHNLQNPFTYTFYLNDGVGPTFNVDAKIPPEVTQLECKVTFPDYTHLPEKKMDPSNLSLLLGSHLHITAKTSNPLSKASVVLNGTTASILPVNLSVDPNQFEADIPVVDKGLSGFSIHLVDSSSVESTNETVYPIEIVPDLPPAVTITDPKEDKQTITLLAKPTIVFDATDDFGVATLQLKYKIQAPPIAGQAAGTPTVVGLPIPVQSNESHYEFTLDLSKDPAFQEGTTVTCWIEATDGNTVSGPGITKTPEKEFDVISRQDKQAELLDKLKAKASDIQNLSKIQTQLGDTLRESIPPNP